MAVETIGLVGVGLLGTALAERLLGAGYRVVGYDVDSSRMEQLQQMGGEGTACLPEVAAACERLIFSLPNSQAVAQVARTLRDQFTDRTLIVDTTTGDPQSTESLAGQLWGQGVVYLDATVAGSSHQARQGDIVIMVGGPQPAVDRCDDIFSTLAKRTFHVGPAGSGARMKLVVNLVLGLHRAVLAEGLSLARVCGMDTATTLEVLRSGAAYSTAMDTKGAKMVQRDFTPQARLAQHRKDVGLILALAEQQRTELPLSQLHAELLDRAIKLGCGDLDNSAILKVFD